MPALDGLRGVAVLLVMVHHFVLYGLPESQSFAYRAAMGGWIGVDLFFVLSGFLITGILLDSKGRGGYFRVFYARRTLRIFPLYYLSLAVFFFAVAPLMGHEKLGQRWFWLYASNLKIAFDGWHTVPGYLGHFWSLAIEEQFYLVWPLVVFALPRRALLSACGFLAAACLAFRIYLHSQNAEAAAYVLATARAVSLAVGAALATLMRSHGGRVALERWSGAVQVASLAALVAVFAVRGVSNYDEVVGTVGYSLLALTFAGFVYRGAMSSPRVLNLSALRQAGTYSYALYVCHQPIALLLRTMGLADRSFALYFATCSVLSVLLALVSWHTFEKHFLALKDRFAHAPAPKPVQRPAPVLAGIGLPYDARRKL